MYPIVNRIIFNITLIPISIISSVIAIPITLFLLPFGIYFTISLNNNVQDKLFNSFFILIYGLPFYYCLSMSMVFNMMAYNFFNYLGIKYYNY
jgi:hypothetical protein